MSITYNIRLTLRAQDDIAAIFLYLDRERHAAAVRFIQQLDKHIDGLRWAPVRYPKIRERLRNRRIYRHIPFLRYRIIFRIQLREVIIMRIVHQARLLREVE